MSKKKPMKRKHIQFVLDESDDDDMPELEGVGESQNSPNPKTPSSIFEPKQFKMDFKITTIMFDTSVDVDKVDEWIDHLEMYFILWLCVFGKYFFCGV